MSARKDGQTSREMRSGKASLVKFSDRAKKKNAICSSSADDAHVCYPTSG